MPHESFHFKGKGAYNSDVKRDTIQMAGVLFVLLAGGPTKVPGVDMGVQDRGVGFPLPSVSNSEVETDLRVIPSPATEIAGLRGAGFML